MSLCLTVELGMVMPVCVAGVGDRLMMSGCMVLPLCLVGVGDTVMVLVCLLVA